MYSAVKATKRTTRRLVILAGIFGLFLFEPSRTYSQVIVAVKPVRPKVVVVKPAKSRRGYIRISGSWKWSRRKAAYVWTEGYWVRKKRGHRYVA